MVDANGNVTADGAVCVWEPGELSFGGMMKALSAIGREKLFPNRSNKVQSLHDAVIDFARRSIKPQRGRPLKAFRLQDGICGFEVRQIHPQADMVDPVPLFSVVAGDDDKVSVIRHNQELLSKLGEADTKSKSEAYIQQVYDRRRSLIHSSTVTSVVNRLMSVLQSTPIRKSGGCYWIPDTHLASIDAFANALSGESTNFEITVWKSTVSANEQTFKAIAESVKEQMRNRLEAVEKSLLDADKRINENGKQSRTAECYAVLDMAEEYKTFLGSELSAFQKMATDLSNQVNMAAALDFCA